MKKIFELPTLLILDFIYTNSPVRHKDIAQQTQSRGTLSASLNALLEEGLIVRQVKTDTKPIQTYYLITDKGKIVAKKLQEIRKILKIQVKTYKRRESPL